MILSERILEHKHTNHISKMQVINNLLFAIFIFMSIIRNKQYFNHINIYIKQTYKRRLKKNTVF
jgi:hypothetical protein